MQSMRPALLNSTIIPDGEGAGVFRLNEYSICTPEDPNVIRGNMIGGNKEGGIVGYNSGLCIFDNLIFANHYAGIRAHGSPMLVDTNLITNTLPRVPQGNFGDGIFILPLAGAQPATVLNTVVEFSARAGLSNFGSDVSIGNIQFRCAAFELEGENVPSGAFGPGIPATPLNFSFTNLGGNLCGCPVPNSSCILVSVGLEPPPPVPSN